MTIGKESITFEDNGDGTYTATITTDNVDAFMQQQILTGTLNITKENYESISNNVQIIVTMPEIFEGMPVFYFLLVVGAVAIIVVTIGVNRAIVNARIPAFVKLINRVKKDIIGLITTLVLVLIILIPPIINYALIPGMIMILTLLISFYSIYFKLVFSSDGIIRKATLVSLIGWILLFMAYITFGIIIELSGFQIERIVSGIISHIIAIIGVILIFLGTRMLKR